MSEFNKEILKRQENIKINKTPGQVEEKPAQPEKSYFNVASINTDGEYSIDDINSCVQSKIKLYNVGIIFWQEFEKNSVNFDWLFGQNFKMREQREFENIDIYNIVFYNKNDFTDCKEYFADDEKFKIFEESVSDIQISDMLKNRFSWILLIHNKSENIFLAASIHNFNNKCNNGKMEHGKMSNDNKNMYLSQIIEFLVDVTVKFNSTFNDKNATILIGMDANLKFYDKREISKT